MGFRLEMDNEEEAQLRAQAKLVRKQKTSHEKYGQHPWPFIRDCIVTLDQARNRIAKFPADIVDKDHDCKECGRCTNYLHHTVNRWFLNKRILVPKSRRMIITWTMLACHYWLARFNPGTAVAIQSRKLGENQAQGSWELIERIKFMERHLPEEVEPIECDMPKGPIISWPSQHSSIIGIAQGANQLRQLTLTAIMADEIAFWEEARESYVASLPTLEGGGRYTAVSSANPGFFKQMVFDEISQFDTA